MPTSSRPHLLYVAWGYPPCRGSGVYRAWATANAFAEAGWDVTVLTAPRETFTLSTGVDESLERTVDPRIDIVRVPFHAAAFENDLRRWPRARARNPELWNVRNARRERRTFPERTYGTWHDGLRDASVRVHEEHPVDLVLGSGNPHVDFVPGWTLHERFGVPYVMDYRDAWQLDVFSGSRVTAEGSEVARWERRLIESAHAVWFVNEPIRRWHAELYPLRADRFHVVANGYDTAPPNAPAPERAGLVFGYLGTISPAVPLDRLVEGWRLARERSDLLAASTIELWGHLDHSGTPNETVARVMASFEANDVSYHGPVAKHDIGDVYSRFDALLLILGTGRYVTSGKVYEYAATGLPIISVHAPGNAATDVLRGAPAWFAVADLTAEEVSRVLIEAAGAARLQTPEERMAGRVWAEKFQRGRQLGPQITALESYVLQERARG